MSESQEVLNIFAEHDNEDAPRTLEQRLYDFNAKATGVTEWRPLRYCVRDAAGTLEGGLTGYLWGGVLHITMAWLSERARRKGLGSLLLSAAETFARENGAHAAYLSTFDFQAPEFYRKHGYACFGELANCPHGHTQYFMRKPLARPPS